MRLTSFYANLLQYKLLNVHISKKQKSSREDERAMEILRKKTEEVSYPVGETDQHEDQSWKTFWILFTVGNVDSDIGRHSGRYSGRQSVDIAVDSRSIVGRQSVDSWSIVGR